VKKLSLPPVKAEVEVKAEPGVAQIAAGAPSLIETPSWVVRVTASEDDQMEAREEMSAPNRSPSKRLRHGVVGSQVCSQAIRHGLTCSCSRTRQTRTTRARWKQLVSLSSPRQGTVTCLQIGNAPLVVT